MSWRDSYLWAHERAEQFADRKPGWKQPIPRSDGLAQKILSSCQAMAGRPPVSWLGGRYGTPNSEVMLKVEDLPTISHT